MHTDPFQTAVIFAGGKSSRMGRDKALLPFGDFDTMAEFQYRKLQALFPTVYLSSKAEKFGFGAPIVIDRYTESSPMVALASLFETLDSEVLFVLSVDMPLIHRGEIELLCRTYLQRKPDILIAESPRGPEPLCGIYHRSILSQIQTLLKQKKHRMRLLLDSVNTEMLYFDNAESFANINTQEEYRSIYN